MVKIFNANNVHIYIIRTFNQQKHSWSAGVGG